MGTPDLGMVTKDKNIILMRTCTLGIFKGTTGQLFPIHCTGHYTDTLLVHGVPQPYSTIALRQNKIFDDQIVIGIFILENQDSPILHNQYHGCWYPDDARNQGISRHGITLLSYHIFRFQHM